MCELLAKGNRRLPFSLTIYDVTEVNMRALAKGKIT